MRALNIAVALAGLLWVDVASAQHARVGFGTPATPDQIGGWDIDVRPMAGDCHRVLARLRGVRKFTRSNARRATARRGKSQRKASTSSLAAGVRLLRRNQYGPSAAIGRTPQPFSITSVALCLSLHRKASPPMKCTQSWRIFSI